ncbi:MAG: D-tyrosyl-tRNA(Tyr) deacylase [Chlamydiales bacterium]|nr:D-tyrosyl-tRNA(Tyr) deacylase [Chlamydiales bacterium]
MKAIIQCVSSASVSVGGNVVSSINKGMLVLLGIHLLDAPEKIDSFVTKLLELRFFPDDQDKMNLSIQDIQGEILVVSQFTLYADCSKGRRPSFTQAMGGAQALIIYETLVQTLKNKYEANKIKTGVFGANMQVSLVNEGPVTLEVVL